MPYVTILQRDELRGDDGQQQQAVVLDQQLDEIAGGLRQLRLDEGR